MSKIHLSLSTCTGRPQTDLEALSSKLVEAKYEFELDMARFYGVDGTWCDTWIGASDFGLLSTRTEKVANIDVSSYRPSIEFMNHLGARDMKYITIKTEEQVEMGRYKYSTFTNPMLTAKPIATQSTQPQPTACLGFPSKPRTNAAPYQQRRQNAPEFKYNQSDPWRSIWASLTSGEQKIVTSLKEQVAKGRTLSDKQVDLQNKIFEDITKRKPENLDVPDLWELIFNQ